MTDDGATVPLFGDGPVRYDAELLAMLGLPEPQPATARAAMLAVFGGGEQGQERIHNHYLGYQAWLLEGATAAQEVAGDAAGEY